MAVSDTVPAPSPAQSPRVVVAVLDERRAEQAADHALLDVALATLLGAALRVLATLPGGMWRDEALFVFVVRLGSWKEMLHWIAESESHPPLYYVLARAWAGVFGAGEWSLVALSLIFGVAIIPLAYVAGRSIGSRQVGVVAAFVFALSPALIEYSAVVRPYALLALLCLLSIHALCRALRVGDRRSWIMFAGSGIALLYTHNWCMLVLVAEAAVVMLAIARRSAPPDTMRRAVVSFGAIALLYVPWAPFFLHQARHAGHVPADLSSPFWFIDGYAEAEGEFVFFWLWLLVLAAWSASSKRRERNATVESHNPSLPILIAVPVIAYAAAVGLSLRSSALFFRCLVIVFPCVLLALALWLVLVYRQRALLVGLVLMLGQWVFATRSEAVVPVPRSNAPAVARYIDRHARAEDLIVIAPVFYASSLNYYLASKNEQIDYPQFGRRSLMSFADVFGRIADPQALRQTEVRLRTAAATGRRVWLVRRAQGKATPDEGELYERGDWAEMGYLRARQVRDMLLRLYGPPQLTIGDRGVLRYERVILELYTREDQPHAPREQSAVADASRGGRTRTNNAAVAPAAARYEPASVVWSFPTILPLPGTSAF